MGLFPTDAADNAEVTNAAGTTFRYDLADDKWQIIPNADVYTEAEVDAEIDTDITTHDNVHATPHGAVSAATASHIVVRDAAGRAKFVASAAAGDAVIHEQLHAAVTVTAPITLVGQLINIENDVAAVITEIDTGVLAASHTKVPTSQAVVTAIAAAGGGAIFGYENIQMHLGTAATHLWGIVLDAVNDAMRCHFYMHAGVDATEDLVFTFVHNSPQADATIAFKKYADAAAVGSEGISWSISNNVAVNLESTVANRVYKTDITIPAASITAGDQITFQYVLNEAGRSMYFNSCVVKYTIA